MSTKSKGFPLQTADQYLWLGPPLWTKFSRGMTFVNLGTITNERVAQLLQEDPTYWGQKFEKIASKAKKAKETTDT